ncbi:MAG TPA: flagellar biosynthesis protein FlgB [Acidobacteriaceae bacterium]|jgi:flagellar basal-body rod protein FlgB|nr:flagellar biosynthesis protein FlgB [Acidobacteriaceae bacterium]
MEITTPVADAVSRYLDLSSLELKLTAQNMANVDTPGYRTTGFNFAAEMSRSLQQVEQGSGNEASPEVGPVDGLLERPDGNNVSMDREGLKMAEAQLQFRTGVALLRNEFSRVMDAIHEDQK